MDLELKGSNGRTKKLHNEELCNFYSLPHYQGNQMKENDMSRTWGWDTHTKF